MYKELSDHINLSILMTNECMSQNALKCVDKYLNEMEENLVEDNIYYEA